MTLRTTIDALAKDIETDWARAGRKPDAFPDVAAQCLDRPLGIDLETIARHLCNGLELPQQRRMDQGFGQPALTLHYAEDFVIEALCWHTGSPGIHQHAFSGAFRVLTGRSFHSRFSFSEHERLDASTILGVLTLEDVELLDDTTVTRIPHGSELIHAAFHLDNPSMTLIARTHDGSDAEYTYLPPGLAYDPSVRSATCHKRLQLLDTLFQSRHEVYAECVASSIANSDLYEGMQLIMRVGRHAMDDATYGGFVEGFVERHGPAAARVCPALAEDRRRSALVGVRATVSDETVRYFLACLMNFTTRAPLLETVVAYAGGQAEAYRQISAGVRTLLRLRDDAAEVVNAGVEAMLHDVPLASIGDWLTHRWGGPLEGREAELAQQFYGQLLQHPLLTPLRKDG